MIVRLSEEQGSFLIAIAEERCPEEACGLLFGDPERIWLIISSISHRMAAYQTIGGSFQKLDLKVIDQER